MAAELHNSVTKWNQAALAHAKNDVVDVQENEAQNPEKTYRGGQFAVFTKIFDFLRLRNQIRKRSLVIWFPIRLLIRFLSFPCRHVPLPSKSQ
mgnify:CR=1 FL=1